MFERNLGDILSLKPAHEIDMYSLYLTYYKFQRLHLSRKIKVTVLNYIAIERMYVFDVF